MYSIHGPFSLPLSLRNISQCAEPRHSSKPPEARSGGRTGPAPQTLSGRGQPAVFFFRYIQRKIGGTPERTTIDLRGRKSMEVNDDQQYFV